MNVRCIYRNDSSYPEALSRYLSEHAPKTIMAIVNLGTLQNKTLSIFSSIKCHGNIILTTYDMKTNNSNCLVKNLYESDSLPQIKIFMKIAGQR